jgi:hypothetical protein
VGTLVCCDHIGLGFCLQLFRNIWANYVREHKSAHDGILAK